MRPLGVTLIGYYLNSARSDLRAIRIVHPGFRRLSRQARLIGRGRQRHAAPAQRFRARRRIHHPGRGCSSHRRRLRPPPNAKLGTVPGPALFGNRSGDPAAFPPRFLSDGLCHHQCRKHHLPRSALNQACFPVPRPRQAPPHGGLKRSCGGAALQGRVSRRTYQKDFPPH